MGFDFKFEKLPQLFSTNRNKNKAKNCKKRNTSGGVNIRIIGCSKKTPNQINKRRCHPKCPPFPRQKPEPRREKKQTAKKCMKQISKVSAFFTLCTHRRLILFSKALIPYRKPSPPNPHLSTARPLLARRCSSSFRLQPIIFPLAIPFWAASTIKFAPGSFNEHAYGLITIRGASPQIWDTTILSYSQETLKRKDRLTSSLFLIPM